MTRLHEEHDRLLVLVKELSAVVAKPEPPPQLELFELRTRLASTLIGHLKSEDWALYPALFRHPDPAVAETARRFIDEMGGLAGAFGVYAERWTTMTIQKSWAAFCLESRDIITALVERIEREESELYPLAKASKRAA